MQNAISGKVILVGVLVLVTALSAVVYSHCEIPCGIYNDQMRFDMIAENITTIEKSIRQINELSKAEKPDMNQLVRWIDNKDKHADEASHTLTYYFLAQRIGPVDKSDSANYQKYVNKLALLHQMVFYSMKVKQSADLANVEKLRSLLSEFQAAFSPEPSHK